MTDREAAAGLVERLESLADLDSRSGAPLAKAMHEAAAFITTLRSELERAGKENEHLNRAIADPLVVYVNLLHGKIAKPTWEQIKHIYVSEFEAAEARALKAEKERDEANLELNRYRAEVDDLNSECDRLDLEKGTAEALVAEAEGLLRRLKHRIVYQVMNSHDPDALAIEAFLNRERSHLRAARAFIERAKS